MEREREGDRKKRLLSLSVGKTATSKEGMYTEHTL